MRAIATRDSSRHTSATLPRLAARMDRTPVAYLESQRPMVLSSSSPFLKFRSYFCGGVSGDSGAEEPAWAPRPVQPPPSEPWVAEPSGQPTHRHAQRVEHRLDLHIVVIGGAGASRKSLTQLRTWEGGEHVGTARARTGRADLARAPPGLGQQNLVPEIPPCCHHAIFGISSTSSRHQTRHGTL